LSTAVSILIRAEGAEESLRNCLSSLAQFAPTDCFPYVLGGSLSESKIVGEFDSLLPKLSHVDGEAVHSFVKDISELQTDVLILDASAEVTEGFLEELQTVLYLHERHAAVSPRSNHARFFSIPFPEVDTDASASYAVWQQIHRLLPRYQVMPAAAKFCLLIKAEVLNRFRHLRINAWDNTDDFVCRINRYGYSAVAANWAYVFQHKARLTTCEEEKLEEAHDEALQFQYPEYERMLADYEQSHRNPLERFASLYLPHRPRILFDLFHLTCAHSGTSEFGLNLLHELYRILEDKFELIVGMNQANRVFASELAGYRFQEDRPDSGAVFDLVFKPCQITSWAEFRRMHQFAPRISYTLLDIIGVRCEYMNSPRRQILLQKASELSDCIFTISEFSHSDFAAFYQLDIPMRVVHLGTNAGITGGEFRVGEHVLIVGNDFAHKGIRDAMQQLAHSTLPLVVLGGEEEPGTPNVRWLSSGNLSRQHVRELFSNARVVVYPSYYEGFGLPVVDALALGKPVVVFDSVMNRELAALTSNSKFYRIGSLDELSPTVAKLFAMEEDQSTKQPSAEPRRWSDVAVEYAQAFQEILARDIDLAKLRARWETLRNLDAADPV
jgi:glycosyltransferase involved in cell wall biosynthesis